MKDESASGEVGGSHNAVLRRREALREAVRVEVVGEGENSSVKLGPVGGRLGEWRRWLGEGRQVIGRLCEEVERLPARSIEEWRAEEEARRRCSVKHGLAGRGPKWSCGCPGKTWAKSTGERRSVAWFSLGGGAHSGNGEWL